MEYRESLLLSALPLAKSLVTKAARRQYGTCWDDFYQEALIGVWEATKAYDSTKGASFTSYAYRYILDQIRKHKRFINSFGIKAVKGCGGKSFKPNILQLPQLPSTEEPLIDSLDTIEVLLNKIENTNSRRVAEMYFLEGIPQKEIAIKIEKSKPRVEQLMAKAKKDMYRAALTMKI
jgi:RNA polymerase sigma factor (sigma-70 family)